jgi:hypothetical protein
MKDWLRYAELTAKAKTGMSVGFAAWLLVAILALLTTWAFINVSGFVLLAARYDPLIAALSLSAAWLVIGIVALIAAAIVRRRNSTMARLALSERTSNPWLDPRLLSIGIEIGRSLGRRSLVPIVVIGMLALGVARELFRRDEPPRDS